MLSLISFFFNFWGFFPDIFAFEIAHFRMVAWLFVTFLDPNFVPRCFHGVDRCLVFFQPNVDVDIRIIQFSNFYSLVFQIFTDIIQQCILAKQRIAHHRPLVLTVSSLLLKWRFLLGFFQIFEFLTSSQFFLPGLWIITRFRSRSRTCSNIAEIATIGVFVGYILKKNVFLFLAHFSRNFEFLEILNFWKFMNFLLSTDKFKVKFLL